jgi:hypothetical protein
MAEYFKEPTEILNYVHDKIDENSGSIGLAFVGYGEELLIPKYPAILIVAGPVTREWHTTHQWRLTLMFELWVYHASLSESRRTRTRDDLALVTGVRETLHSDIRLRDTSGEPQCISAWVNAEDPAFIRRPKNEAVVASRLEYTVMSMERFK